MPQVFPETGIISLEKNCPIQHIHSGTDTPRIKTSDLINDGGITFISRVRVYSAGGQAIVSGATTLVAFDTETFDGDSEFNTTSHLFTALSSGYYQVNGSILWGSPENGKQYNLYIYKNSDKHSTDWKTAIMGTELSNNISDIIYLAAGDTVSLYGYNGGVGACSISGDTRYSFLSIHRLS